MGRWKLASPLELFARVSRYLRAPGAVTFVLLLGGCSAQSSSYELSSYAPAADQLALANYHSEEAQRLKQKSEELLARAVLYDRLFGADSEWAAGARLLAQFYEDESREQARLAEQHINFAHERQLSKTARRKKED
jgi:hypothetical protein